MTPRKKSISRRSARSLSAIPAAAIERAIPSDGARDAIAPSAGPQQAPVPPPVPLPPRSDIQNAPFSPQSLLSDGRDRTYFRDGKTHVRSYVGLPTQLQALYIAFAEDGSLSFYTQDPLQPVAVADRSAGAGITNFLVQQYTGLERQEAQFAQQAQQAQLANQPPFPGAAAAAPPPRAPEPPQQSQQPTLPPGNPVRPLASATAEELAAEAAARRTDVQAELKRLEEQAERLRSMDRNLGNILDALPGPTASK